MNSVYEKTYFVNIDTLFDVYTHIFMKSRFLLLIISLCLVSKTLAQNFSDLLSFQQRPDSLFLWYCSTHNMMLESYKKSIANSDSSFYTISNGTISIYTKDKISYPIYGDLFSDFLVPIKEAKMMKASVSTFSSNMYRVSFYIYKMDKNGFCFGVDTIPLKLTGLNDGEKNIDISGADKIGMMFHVWGRNGSDHQQFVIKRIKLYIDGKDLDDYPLIRCNNLIMPTKKDVIAFEDNRFNKIEWLRTCPILGIGETIHGSETLNAEAIDIMKYRVEKCGCRLLLLEMPIEQMLYVNQYVQGDTRFNVDKIKEYLSKALLSDGWLHFIEWLKNYNEGKSAKEKVKLLGCFYEDGIYNEADIFDFVRAFYQPTHSPLLYTLCDKIHNDIDSRGIPSDYISYLEKNTELFGKLMGTDNIKTLIHVFNLKKEYWRKKDLTRKPSDLLDSIMYANFLFFAKMYDVPEAKATMYFHYGHINYGYPELYQKDVCQMGYYIRKEYGDNYRTLSLTAAEGKTLNLGKKGELELCELEPPVCGSVEQVIDETSDTIAYLSTKGFDGYCYMRFVGSLGSRHQFLSYNVGHATDGILLFKKSAPMVKIETRCDPSHYSIYEYLERSKMQREYLQKMKLDM